jgi:thymidine phosphorylase
VPSIPLIAASVMSKKFAIGSDLIVLDVKAGSGAFMPDVTSAETLARACLALASARDRRATVAVTDMSQPLGTTVGNALEVAEAIEVLSGTRRGRLRDLAVWFAARATALLMDVPIAAATGRAERALTDGSALESFRAVVEAQGGDACVVDRPADLLPSAPVRQAIEVAGDGWIGRVDAAAIGAAANTLGAGRHRKGAPIDPAVGIVLTTKVGDTVRRGEVIGEVHARSEDAAQLARAAVLPAVLLSDEPVPEPPLIAATLGEEPAG